MKSLQNFRDCSLQVREYEKYFEKFGQHGGPIFHTNFWKFFFLDHTNVKQCGTKSTERISLNFLAKTYLDSNVSLIWCKKILTLARWEIQCSLKIHPNNPLFWYWLNFLKRQELDSLRMYRDKHVLGCLDRLKVHQKWFDRFCKWGAYLW